MIILSNKESKFSYDIASPHKALKAFIQNGQHHNSNINSEALISAGIQLDDGSEAEETDEI